MTLLYCSLINFFTILPLSNTYKEKDSIMVVSSIDVFSKMIKTDPKVLLRTYNIRFKALDQCEINENEKTNNFIDSLAAFLKSNKDATLEVGVHLSIKYSSRYSSRYDCMPKAIIEELVKRNVCKDQLVGTNYLNTKPIITTDRSESESEEFWENELNVNKRVEFRLIPRK